MADGFFAVAFGLLTHLGPVPPVTGSQLVTSILTGGVDQGGKYYRRTHRGKKKRSWDLTALDRIGKGTR
ncbi:MAG: hypothetical protein ACOY30_08025 [Bacillota bacterium]